MKRPIPYVNEEVSNRDLKYYIFDWDDNILHMPTRIQMEHREKPGAPWRPVEVSTATFALVRADEEHYRAPGGVWAEAFRNFEDAPGRDNFIEDTIAALEKIEHGEKPSPSFNTFRKTLVEGRIFAIVTARGHAPETIEKAVRVFIKYVLTEEEREIMMSNLRGYRQWIDGVGDGEFGTDADNGDAATNECATTSIRLELTPVWEAPENPCANRHMYGVGEKVHFKVRPQLSSVVLSTTKYDTGDYEDSAYECFGTNVLADASIDRIYTCPISANYHPPIKVTFGTVEYLPTISLVEPDAVITTGAAHGLNKVDIFNEEWRRCWPRGSVGTATLVTTNYIGPMTVSFRGIAVSEIPCEEEDIVTGCFTNGHARTHTFAVGAGRAYPIKDGNFWFVDGAGIGRIESNWIPNSEMVWKIPVGWHRRGASDDWFGVSRPDYEVRNRFSSRSLVLGLVYRQRFSIDENGVFKIEKYGHWISRSRFCRVVLDGNTVQESHP